MVGDIYIKFKNLSKKYTQMSCLKKDLFDHITEYRITCEDDEKNIPDDYYKLERIGTKPEVPEGKYLAYHFDLIEGIKVVHRHYLVADSIHDIALLTVFDYEDAVQEFLNKKAREKGYDDVYSCISYLGDPNETYNAEATKMINWRSEVWLKANEILSKWQTGEISQPTIQEVLDQLPNMEWDDEENSNEE